MPPSTAAFSDWAGAQGFRDGRRRAFIAAKTTDLSGLVAEPGRTEGAESDAGRGDDLPARELLGALARRARRRLGRSERRRVRPLGLTRTTTAGGNTHGRLHAREGRRGGRLH